MTNDNKENGIVGKIANGIKLVTHLELKTSAGKINTIFGIILVIMVCTLTATEWLLKGFLSFVSFLKTVALGKEIVEKYETTNVILLTLIVIAFFVYVF